jgi:uncharacterized protein (TIGR02996 family)
MFSPEESAFIERIREDHLDDLPRLIYADWLDERGEHDRADFIRVQCALEELDERDASGDKLREYECSLLEKNGRVWATGIGELVEGYSFRRGMIEAATVKPGQFLAIGEDGFRRFPIRRFRFIDMGVDVAKIFRSPLVRHISELDFSQCTLDQISCVSIAKSKYLRNLHLLDLGFTAIDYWGLSILMNSPVVAPLRSLRLNENRTLDANCLAVVLRSQQSGLLASIDLTGNLLNCAALEPLLSGYQSLPALRSVNWEGNLIGQGMKQFVQSPLFAYLCEQNPVLNLASNEIDSNAMRELADSKSLPNIRRLILDQYVIPDLLICSLRPDLFDWKR